MTSQNPLQFVCLEGISGSGKDTQANLLARDWRDQGYTVDVYDFPAMHRLPLAQTPPAMLNVLRALYALSHPHPADQHAAALLHLALMRLVLGNMQQIWQDDPQRRVIWVRGPWSTAAYNGCYLGVEHWQAVFGPGAWPPRMLWLMVPLEVAQARCQERGRGFGSPQEREIEECAEGRYRSACRPGDAWEACTLTQVPGIGTPDEVHHTLLEALGQHDPINSTVPRPQTSPAPE